MQIWNGWGDEHVTMGLAPGAKDLLRDRIGEELDTRICGTGATAFLIASKRYIQVA